MATRTTCLVLLALVLCASGHRAFALASEVEADGARKLLHDNTPERVPPCPKGITPAVHWFPKISDPYIGCSRTCKYYGMLPIKSDGSLLCAALAKDVLRAGHTKWTESNYDAPSCWTVGDGPDYSDVWHVPNDYTCGCYVPCCRKPVWKHHHKDSEKTCKGVCNYYNLSPALGPSGTYNAPDDHHYVCRKARRDEKESPFIGWNPADQAHYPDQKCYYAGPKHHDDYEPAKRRYTDNFDCLCT